jgi:hypothetical protein
MVLVVIGGILVVAGAAILSFAQALKTVNNLPRDEKPMILMGRTGLWAVVGTVGTFAMVVGFVLLFIVKWYAGVVGIVASFALSRFALVGWLHLYRSFFVEYVHATRQQDGYPSVRGYVSWRLKTWARTFPGTR